MQARGPLGFAGFVMRAFSGVRLQKAQTMSRPFRFMISVQENREFEITGWGEAALEALRDALCSSRTALRNHFAMGNREGFEPDDLRIEADGKPGGYSVTFHPQNGSSGADRPLPDPWAIRAVLSGL